MLTENLGNTAWFADSRLRLESVRRNQMPALCGSMPAEREPIDLRGATLSTACYDTDGITLHASWAL